MSSIPVSDIEDYIHPISGYNELRNQTYRVEFDGTIRFWGIAFPTLNNRFIYKTEHFAVFYASGGSAWSGRGEKAYYPAEYYLMELGKNYSIKRGYYKAESSRKTWRKLRSWFIAKCDEFENNFNGGNTE